jgi:hypothetical protein
VRLLLTSEDDVFEEVRNEHFSNVFRYLGAKARALQSGYDVSFTLRVLYSMSFKFHLLSRQLNNQFRIAFGSPTKIVHGNSWSSYDSKLC